MFFVCIKGRAGSSLVIKNSSKVIVKTLFGKEDYKYGVILNDLGKYEEAKEKYEKALSLPAMENSLQSGLFYYYSSLCLKQYEYNRAKDYILKALEIEPNNEYYQDLYDKINYYTSDSNL